MLVYHLVPNIQDGGRKNISPYKYSTRDLICDAISRYATSCDGSHECRDKILKSQKPRERQDSEEIFT